MRSTNVKLDKIISTACTSDKRLVKLQGWQLADLSPSTKDPAQALGSESAESQPLDHQGIPSRLVNNGMYCYLCDVPRGRAT